MANGTRSRRRRLGAGRNRLGRPPTDDVFHHTITYHPIMEAAHAAPLASSWRHLWCSHLLVLKDTDIPEPAHDAVVPGVLDDQPSHSRVVFLADYRLASPDHELPSWPRLLAEKRTEKLLLGYKCVMDQPNSVRLLPADILRCDSLQWLGLDFWTFPVDLFGCADVSLPHLRTLYIKKIDISSHDLEYLIAACPVLESLRLAFNSSKHVRLCNKSPRCALVGLSPHLVEEFTVVDTLLLRSSSSTCHLIMWRSGSLVLPTCGCSATWTQELTSCRLVRAPYSYVSQPPVNFDRRKHTILVRGSWFIY